MTDRQAKRKSLRIVGRWCKGDTANFSDLINFTDMINSAGVDWQDALDSAMRDLTRCMILDGEAIIRINSFVGSI